jgi:hypothetical protein
MRAIRCPNNRRASTYMTGMAATAATTERLRMAVSESPKTAFQPWRSR